MTAETSLRCVTVFGGSGFLGDAIVRRLSADSTTVRVAVRHPDAVHGGRREGNADVRPVYADVRDETSVGLALEGSDAVVNAVGLYLEKGAETFEAVHELGALNVAHQAVAHNVRRLVHVSGIGAELHSRSAYVRARAKGELMVTDVFPRATILRPSVLFAADDAFLNALAEIARRTPVLPLFGRGDTRLQPVHVGDVAEAAHAALTRPDAPGGVYELGGPRVYRYRELVALVLRRAGLRRLLLPLPFAVWDLLAAAAMLLPAPPITRAQVTLMKRDNVAGETVPGLAALGVTPTPLEDILPDYPFARAT